MELDVRKKLQDKANEIMNEAILRTGTPLPDALKEMLSGIVALSLKQGFIYGVNSIKETTNVLLENLKGK